MASRDGVEVGPHVEGVGEVAPAVDSEEDQGNRIQDVSQMRHSCLVRVWYVNVVRFVLRWYFWN